MTPDFISKVAKILRTDDEIILDMEKKMNNLTEKKGMLARIAKRNDVLTKQVLKTIKMDYQSSAEKIYAALIEHLKISDERLFNLLQKPQMTMAGLTTLSNIAKELADIPKGFFLKKDKAREILRRHPPPNIMKALGYKNVQELLDNEPFEQLYSALRFVESSDWMNDILVGEYEALKPKDFEERDVKLIVLDKRWLEIAEKFIKKKYHNVSHLKELGVLFIIPLPIDTPGETLRLFSLVLHYFHEIDFYSKLIRKYAEEEKNFAKKLMSLIRGDVMRTAPPDGQEMNWLIVQRYLAKDDPNDPRLFIPHVSPEAIHWQKAESDIARLGHRFSLLNLELWEDLDIVGDYFNSELYGQKLLVSFNLIDTIMSLVKEKELIKYLYHHQESLWTTIFLEYVGPKQGEDMIIENFDRGYITL
ncbi:MAG: hypothetical protein HYV52_00065 [Parcubacteria group bacterium]|nr:hypothetical protein [Parcubacteria group bacterium]